MAVLQSRCAAPNHRLPERCADPNERLPRKCGCGLEGMQVTLATPTFCGGSDDRLIDTAERNVALTAGDRLWIEYSGFGGQEVGFGGVDLQRFQLGMRYGGAWTYTSLTNGSSQQLQQCRPPLPVKGSLGVGVAAGHEAVRLVADRDSIVGPPDGPRNPVGLHTLTIDRCFVRSQQPLGWIGAPGATDVFPRVINVGAINAQSIPGGDCGQNVQRRSYQQWLLGVHDMRGKRATFLWDVTRSRVYGEPSQNDELSVFAFSSQFPDSPVQQHSFLPFAKSLTLDCLRRPQFDYFEMVFANSPANQRVAFQLNASQGFAPTRIQLTEATVV